MSEVASAVESIVWRFGAVGFAIIVLGAIAWVALRPWLVKRIEAGVQAQFEKRLREHQHQLDKQLTDHAQALERDREGLRSSLEKSVVDYRLYAERRHAAVVEMFAALHATRLSLFKGPEDGIWRFESPRLTRERASTYLEEYQPSKPARDEFWAAFNSGDLQEASQLLAGIARNARCNYILDQVEHPTDVYSRASLYLPREIDMAVEKMIELFHDLAVEVVDPQGRQDIVYAELQEQLEIVRALAKSDLGGSADDVARPFRAPLVEASNPAD